MSRFNKGFEYEVPFAWSTLVVEFQKTLLRADAREVGWPIIVILNVHCDFQRKRITSLEAHLDKAPTIPSGGENRSPCLRFVEQRVPPGSTNVCQLQKLVYAVSGALWFEGLEDQVEDVERDTVDGRSWVQAWLWHENFCWKIPSFLGLLPASVLV